MVRTRSRGEILNMVHAEAAPKPAVVAAALIFWSPSPFVPLLLLVLATQPCHHFPSSHWMNSVTYPPAILFTVLDLYTWVFSRVSVPTQHKMMEGLEWSEARYRSNNRLGLIRVESHSVSPSEGGHPRLMGPLPGRREQPEQGTTSVLFLAVSPVQSTVKERHNRCSINIHAMHNGVRNQSVACPKHLWAEQ